MRYLFSHFADDKMSTHILLLIALIKGAPVEDFQHHIAQLVLCVVFEGGWYSLQQVQEWRHEVPQKFCVLLCMNQLDTLADLCHPCELLLKACSPTA